MTVNLSGLVDPDDIFDDRATQGTLARTLAPLADSALVAEGHVTAAVEDAVDFFGVADDALGTVVSGAGPAVGMVKHGVVGSVGTRGRLQREERNISLRERECNKEREREEKPGEERDD